MLPSVGAHVRKSTCPLPGDRAARTSSTAPGSSPRQEQHPRPARRTYRRLAFWHTIQHFIRRAGLPWRVSFPRQSSFTYKEH